LDASGELAGYIVTGATSNVNREANKYYPVAEGYSDWGVKAFETNKNTIGYDWKEFDMTTFSYVIKDSIAFFVKNDIDDVYKLTFSFWEGSSTGKFGLNKEILSLSGLQDNDNYENNVLIYPNPASSVLHIVRKGSINVTKISICDISGRIVYTSKHGETVNNTKVNTNEFGEGLYFVTVFSGGKTETIKLVIY